MVLGASSLLVGKLPYEKNYGFPGHCDASEPGSQGSRDSEGSWSCHRPVVFKFLILMNSDRFLRI